MPPFPPMPPMTKTELSKQCWSQTELDSPEERRLTNHEGPGPPPSEEHAGAATPALSLTVVASHSVHRPGAGRGVSVHFFSSQQVNVVLQREL